MPPARTPPPRPHTAAQTTLRWVWTAITAAMLAACASPPAPGPQASAGITSAAAPALIPAWQGRIALHLPGPQPDDLPAPSGDASAPSASSGLSWNAAFTLRGGPGAGRLELFSPFGSQVADLQWNAYGAWLRQGSDAAPTQQADTLSALLQDALGLDVPAATLFDWLHGQPTPASGWAVDLSEHPRGRIRAQRQPPRAASLRIVLESAPASSPPPGPQP